MRVIKLPTAKRRKIFYIFTRRSGTKHFLSLRLFFFLITLLARRNTRSFIRCMLRRRNSARCFVSVAAVKASVGSISSVEKAKAGVQQQPFLFAKSSSSSSVKSSFVTAHHRLLSGFVSTTTPGTTTTRNNNKNNNKHNFQRRMRSPEIPSSILLPPPIGFDEVVVEGKGKVLQRENEVFYNRPQVVNRDLSLAIVREFQKRRKEEHENDTDQKTRRGKGMYNKVPRESKIIAHLVSEREREHMFATKETTREHPATTTKTEDDEKQKEWVEVKPGTFRWQVVGAEEKRETADDAAAAAAEQPKVIIEEEEDEEKKEKPPLEPITILEGM